MSDEFYTTLEVDTDLFAGAKSVPAIPAKLVTDLPVSGSTAFDIVAVVGNKDTVRVSWEALTSNQIRQTGDIPGAGEVVDRSVAPYLTLAADGTGLYISDGEEWRKVATYGGDNWDDIDSGDTRFLPVNKTIELSPEERANVLKSLSIDTATTETEGLVRIPEDTTKGIGIENGVLYARFATPIDEYTPAEESTPGIVYIRDQYTAYNPDDHSAIWPRCAVTARYVYDAIANSKTDIPFASYTEAGLVQIQEGTALTVNTEVGGLLSIKSATDTAEGVVRIHNIYNNQGNAIDPLAASKGYVDKRITDTAQEISTTVATATGLGMVKVNDKTTAITINDGTIDVRYATTDKHGIVKLYDTLSEDLKYTDDGAVTPGAVVNYIDSRHMAIPVATAEDLGGVIIGSGISVSDEGVIAIHNATAEAIGGVKLSYGTNDNSFVVPTLTKVEEMVSSGSASHNIAHASTSTYGTVKLSADAIIGQSLPIGTNTQGQLVAAYSPTSSSGSGEYVPSSATIINNTTYEGLPIAADYANKLYVDVSQSKANTANYGLVKLSVDADTILSNTCPGIGVDAQGCIRVNSSGGSVGGSDYFMRQATKPAGAVDIEYYKPSEDSNYKIPFIPPATNKNLGGVKLGTAAEISSGIPVGVNKSGQLYVAMSGGTSEGGGTANIGNATTTEAGIVKLSASADTPIDGGLQVGVNSDGQLVVAASSTDIGYATTELGGIVRLSRAETVYSSSYGKIGTSSDGAIVVPEATANEYGAVKVAGGTLDASSLKVGVNPSGQLAVDLGGFTPGTGGGGGGSIVSAAPFSVKLIEKEGTTGTYKVTMTGGVIQMNDGSIVNVQPVALSDNLEITPSAGQLLRLKVYVNSSGEAVARLQLTSDIKILSCRPRLA